MRTGVESIAARNYTEEQRTGTTEEEITNAPRVVREAYERWRNPPKFELYDLQTDPNEFHNLAQDPEYADVRIRLLSRLERWQEGTDDRLADPEILERYVNDHIQAHTREKEPRYDPEFTWDYLGYLNRN